MSLVFPIEQGTRTARRFRVILRGDDFLVPEFEEAPTPARVGFYVVRTVAAEDVVTAAKIALFDLQAELQISPGLEPQFLETGALAVEEMRPLADGEEDVSSGFIFYPME